MKFYSRLILIISVMLLHACSGKNKFSTPDKPEAFAKHAIDIIIKNDRNRFEWLMMTHTDAIKRMEDYLAHPDAKKYSQEKISRSRQELKELKSGISTSFSKQRRKIRASLGDVYKKALNRDQVDLSQARFKKILKIKKYGSGTKTLYDIYVGVDYKGKLYEIKLDDVYLSKRGMVMSDALRWYGVPDK